MEKGISNKYLFMQKYDATNPEQTEIETESAPGLTALLSPKQGLAVFFSGVLPLGTHFALPTPPDNVPLSPGQ